jgi:hypothetical protein
MTPGTARLLCLINCILIAVWSGLGWVSWGEGHAVVATCFALAISLHGSALVVLWWRAPWDR